MPTLLARLRADPRPRLTWYGVPDERVELTGRVLVTWVAKTAHLLADEAEVGPGLRLRVELGADWRAPVFVLAAWYLGAGVVEPGSSADVAVVPAGAPTPPGPTLTVVVPLSPLPGEGGPSPAGAVDYGEVAAFPDDLPAPRGGHALPSPTAGPVRVVLGPGTPVAVVVDVWTGGGSVVLHNGLGGERLAAVARQENAVTR